MNKPHQITRREFVKGAIALAAIPGSAAIGQTATGTRLEWQSFKATPDYPAYLSAIAAMRTNTNVNTRNRWSYWVNAHVSYCPHGIAYFLAWHRGVLYQFEQQLRQLTGRPGLMVPYWDYYTNPNMPAEFTDPASPLYVPNRVNTNVYSSLGLNAFADSLTTFERGTTDSFERQLEGRPHNSIHNLIGGYMALRTSPTDPVFWLHHGNIDRLWVAWVAAGEGRTMPAAGSTYWSGSFAFGPSHTMLRSQTMSNTGLGYGYQNETMPAALPPRAQAARIVRVQFRPNGDVLDRPPVRQFQATAPRALGPNRRSVGGVADIALDEGSVSATVPVQVQDRNSLDAVIRTLQVSPLGGARRPQGPYRSVRVVLDNLHVTGLGQSGGYYYNVYLGIPPGGDAASAEAQYFLGTVGPFEIDSATHHGQAAQLSYPATMILAGLKQKDLSQLTISFARVNGMRYPRGTVITIGEARLELSPEEVE